MLSLVSILWQSNQEHVGRGLPGVLGKRADDLNQLGSASIALFNGLNAFFVAHFVNNAVILPGGFEPLSSFDAVVPLLKVLDEFVVLMHCGCGRNTAPKVRRSPSVSEHFSPGAFYARV